MPDNKAAIIEPNESMVSFYRAALTLAGYVIVGIAKDETTGLQIVSEERPNVLLVDFRLTGQAAGLDVIGKAKRLVPEMFTVLITAMPLADVIKKMDLISPDRALQKPFMLRAFLDLLPKPLGHLHAKGGTL